jgi:serine/threonine protein kinase
MTGQVMEGAEGAQRYEILRVVNRGGMGEIALARVKGSKGFEKLVVLKRLRADAERDDHREMFDVEAEVMSRIEHPNIVQVFDQPRIDGVQYLAMAYVRGRNLDQVIRRTRQQGARISPAFTLTTIGEVLRGLAFVHRLKDEQGRALGVVHQDITPSNVLVSFFGEVKLTDFGIAYVTSRDGGRRAGVLKGKPRYVSPEVLAGKRVNNRADIYGVGVVMYEMLAGRALFARPSLEETLAAVARNELPDFRIVFPQLSDGLFNILHRALSKDPGDRYRTAEEMHAEVAAELGRLGGTISPPRIGYLLRQWFAGDPDVPEVDPTLDAAISEPAQPTPAAAPAYQAPNLDQTLSELDRLLGGETSSADLFQLPPEIQRELSTLGDNEPFAALTPIPEIALSGPNGEELLLRGMGVRPLDAPPVMGEPDFGPFSGKTPHRSLLPPSSWPAHAASPPPTGGAIHQGRPIVAPGGRLSPVPVPSSVLPVMPPPPHAARFSPSLTPASPVLGMPRPPIPTALGVPTAPPAPGGPSLSPGPSGFTPRPNLTATPSGIIPSVPGVIVPNSASTTPFAGTTPYPFTISGGPSAVSSPTPGPVLAQAPPGPGDESEDALARSVSGAARRAQLRASRGEYRVTPRGASEVPNVRGAGPPPARAPTRDDLSVEAAVEQSGETAVAHAGTSAQTSVAPPVILPGSEQRSSGGFVAGVAVGFALGVGSVVAYLMMR